MAIAGPRSDPPIPIFDHIGNPPALPQKLARAHSFGKGIGARAGSDRSSGMTSTPSTSITAASSARCAICSTARPSVSLIVSPRKHGVALFRPKPCAFSKPHQQAHGIYRHHNSSWISSQEHFALHDIV